MRQRIVLGNWKMNGSRAMIQQLVGELLLAPPEWLAHAGIIPPCIFLSEIQNLIEHTPLKLGIQNIFPSDNGAFTGEISAPMAKEVGCEYVLVGHSERRKLFHENEKFIAEKFHQAKVHGMIPVLCVGETLEERQAGQTLSIIQGQLNAILDSGLRPFQKAMIAYEPVWAIGTGKTATPTEAQDVHQFIRQTVKNHSDIDANHLTLLYGGSVNAENAQSLFAMPDIDGALVGGASLDAKNFLEIIKCINSYY